jgi:hypothetical protein
MPCTAAWPAVLRQQALPGSGPALRACPGPQSPHRAGSSSCGLCAPGGSGSGQHQRSIMGGAAQAAGGELSGGGSSRECGASLCSSHPHCQLRGFRPGPHPEHMMLCRLCPLAPPAALQGDGPRSMWASEGRQLPSSLPRLARSMSAHLHPCGVHGEAGRESPSGWPGPAPAGLWPDGQQVVLPAWGALTQPAEGACCGGQPPRRWQPCELMCGGSGRGAAAAMQPTLWPIQPRPRIRSCWPGSAGAWTTAHGRTGGTRMGPPPGEHIRLCIPLQEKAGHLDTLRRAAYLPPNPSVMHQGQGAG